MLRALVEIGEETMSSLARLLLSHTDENLCVDLYGLRHAIHSLDHFLLDAYTMCWRLELTPIWDNGK